MSADVSLLTPDTQAALAELQRRAEAAGLRFNVISTMRTCDEQNALYSQGRTAPGNIVTQARGCVSFHVLGRALDFQPLNPDGLPNTSVDVYRAIADVAKGMGWRWGGDFPGFFDGPHLQWTGGMAIESLCPDPDECEVALARSRAMRFPVGGSSGWEWLAMGVGAVVGVLVGALVLADG